jgi:DNA-binding response OmpR family regulator
LRDQKLSDGVEILIVDDDPTTCRLLALQLEMEGFACGTVSDPRAVLSTIAATCPRVVLLDYHLGRHEGLEVLRALRSQEEYTNLSVVIMSGLDYRRECESAGANAFVLKPFTPQTLVETIRRVLKE